MENVSVMGKEITLRRKAPGTGQISSDLAANAVTKISSLFKNNILYKPLTPEEEKKWLPLIHDIDPESKDWRRNADRFWREFEIKVDEEGPILNISLRADGEPVNVRDYVIYRFAASHPKVAESEGKMRSEGRDFYVHDPEKVKMKQHASVSLRKEAYTKFAELSGTEVGLGILSRVLRMRGVNPDFMTAVDVDNAISDVVSNEPEAFLKVVGDKDLKVKAIIEEMVAKNVINKVGTNYLFGDTILGATMMEAVLFIKNPSNSETLNILKAKLSESRKTLPDKPPEEVVMEGSTRIDQGNLGVAV